MKSKLIFSITFLVGVIFTYSQDKILMEASKSIKIDELKEKMYAYSSDEFDGRGTPSEGQKLAVDYLVNHYKNLGIKSVKTDTYLQTVPLQLEEKPDISLNISGQKFIYYRDYVSYLNGPDREYKSEDIIFVGYGIDDPNYSDYKNIDVKGKVVVAIGGEPKDKSNDYQIKDIKQNIRGTSFKLKDNFVKKDYSFSMSMHGEHNVMNATSAIIASIQENIDVSIIKKSLKTCSSIERRFEIISHDIFSKRITLVDDYGHHPKEIKFSHDTASEIWKNKKKIVVFQPHRYTRTKDLFDEFIKTLLNIENLLLLDIYPASERIIKGYEGKDLFHALKKNGSNVVFCQNHAEVIKNLENMTAGNEVIITQGAGTTSELARKISNQ